MLNAFNPRRPATRLPIHRKSSSFSSCSSSWTRRRIVRWLIACVIVFLLLHFILGSKAWSDSGKIKKPTTTAFAQEILLAKQAELQQPGQRIPKIVHFVYGLRDPNPTLDLIHYIAIKSAHDVIKPDKIMFHYHYLPVGEMFERAKPMLTLHPIPLLTKVFEKPVEHYAHRADVVRLQVLREFGGIYLDLDLISLKPLDHLLEHEFVMAQEGKDGSVGLCNAMIMSRPNAQFLQRWYATYATFRGTDWNRHSVVLPGKLAEHFPKEITVLKYKAFFWPLWDTNGLRMLYLEKTYEFNTNLGTHIWESPANRHLIANITEQTILNVDTSLNCKLRPFLLDGKPDPRQGSCQILDHTPRDDRLVGHWPLVAPVNPLEYTNPMRAEDVSGNKLGGVIRNGAYDAGFSEAGVSLTGRDSYIFLTVPRETTIDELTVSWWMQTNSDKANGTAVVVQTDRAKVYVRTESIQVYQRDPSDPLPVSLGLATLELDDDWVWREKEKLSVPAGSRPINLGNEFHHFALVIDKSRKRASPSLTLYMDGFVIASSSTWDLSDYDGSIVRGVWFGSSEPERSGYQDPWDVSRSLAARYKEIHIWNRALDLDSVRSVRKAYLQRQQQKQQDSLFDQQRAFDNDDIQQEQINRENEALKNKQALSQP